MPEILSMEMISNAEVLHFIQAKKREHKQQQQPKAPQNLLTSLDQHESHLESDHYPYTANPSVYGKAGMIKTLPGGGISSDQEASSSDLLAMQKFDRILNETITYPRVKAELAVEKRRLGGGGGEGGSIRKLTSKEKDAIIANVDAERSFSEAERLMILNHAPTCLETLQPMIENIEARYTEQEQVKIVDAIQQAFRADEVATAAEDTGDPEPMDTGS